MSQVRQTAQIAVDSLTKHGVASRRYFASVLSLLAISISLLLFAVFNWFGASNEMDQQLQTINNPLSIPKSALQLGDIWNRRFLRHSVPISNISDRQQTCQLETGCACASVEPAILTLQPQETRTVYVNFNLPFVTPDAPAPLDVRLVGRISSELDLHIAWSIRGTCWTEFSVAPQSIQFNDLRVNSSIAEPQELSIHSSEPIANWEVTSRRGLLKVEPNGTSPTSKKFSAIIRPSATGVATPGEKNDTIDVSTTTKDGRTLEPLEIPAQYVVRHEVAVDQPQVILGQHPIRATAEGTFKVVAATEKAYTVESLTCADHNLTINPVTSTTKAGTAQEYKIQYVIQKIGSNRAEIQIKISDEVEAEPYIISLPVIAIGTINEISG